MGELTHQTVVPVPYFGAGTISKTLNLVYSTFPHVNGYPTRGTGVLGVDARSSSRLRTRISLNPLFN